MDADRLSIAMRSLVELVARLRGPGGCPWDAEQTDATAKIYLLEEAYEVLDAIDDLSPQAVCSELGDLLFQIVFLTQLASERKEFDLAEVVETVTKKMIHRHPHVFGETRVETVEDVASNWTRIKKAENGVDTDTSSLLRNVPSRLPALLRAHRLSERASKVGFDWANADEIWEKVLEEVEEVRTAIVDGDPEAVAEEMGDLLFSLTNLARHRGTNAEDLLRHANQKFLDRFERMERRLADSGIRLEEATLDQMNRAWEELKEQRG
ncbi:MAG: nucleoside triphosphate pyrophosphohydrolase [Deltaproteobacteria bacterium]|nr:nucleoside triphosphate pyrophosphohydrolase [Deltaproteobacteria bacterium]